MARRVPDHKGKLHILWSFNRGVNHVQRTFKRWQESGRHRHLRKAAAKFIALKQVQHRLNVWHTRVSCRSLELGKFGLKLATAHIMQRRNARFFRLWKNDCILRPKKVAQTADLAKRELTKAKVRNGLAHWRIEARRIRLHRTACKLRVMAATAVAQQTLITDDLRDFEVSATETINTWVHTANGLRSDLLRTQEQASRDREQATLEFTRAQDTARARLERMQEDARVELERSQDEAAKALQRAQAEAKVKLDRSLDEANKELQRTQSAAAAGWNEASRGRTQHLLENSRRWTQRSRGCKTLRSRQTLIVQLQVPNNIGSVRQFLPPSRRMIS